jgi:hypothetical protein
MSAEHTGETSSGGPPTSELIRDLGQLAYMLYMDLEPLDKPLPFQAGEQPHWTDPDRQAFGGYIDFRMAEDLVADRFEADRVPRPDSREPLTSERAQAWFRFHVARNRRLEQRFPQLGQIHAGLPFTDQERTWLRHEHRWSWEFVEDDELAAVWRDAEQRARPDEGKRFPIDFQIIKLGDQQGTDTRDLVRRWAAWRRGTDEFTDRTSFEQTREALLSLGQELKPEGPNMKYREVFRAGE